MAKAWRAPESTRAFRYHIITHALQRFRERVEEQFRHRNDEDLARLLDERIHIAVDSGRFMDVEDTRAPSGSVTRVALIEDQRGEIQYVVLRPYEVAFHRPGMAMFGPDGKTTGSLAAITVLTEAMGKRCLAERQWVLPSNAPPPKAAHTLVNKPFAGALAAVTPAPPAKPELKPAPKLEPEPSPPSVAVPPPSEPVAQAEPDHAAPVVPAPRTLPDGWRDRIRREERRAWIRAKFMDQPSMPIKHMTDLVRSTFGVGVNFNDVAEIKREVEQHLTMISRTASAAGAAAAASAPMQLASLQPMYVYPPPSTTPVVVPPPAPPSSAPPPTVHDRTAEIAVAYARAVGDERAARDRVAELEAQLATAKATHASAKAQADELLRQLAEARS